MTGSRPSGPHTTWYGSTAGGAAGKGPVRGYPPVPGQPPPMYPPGQFAAWNRGPGRVSETRPAPGLPARGQSGPSQSGPHTGPVVPGTVRPGANGPGTGYAGPQDMGSPGSRPAAAGSAAGSAAVAGSSWQAPATDRAAGRSRYYDQDLGSGAEPGYSMLAVSDPAADVTSTQTWEAVGDGRATGVWTAPARPGGSPPAQRGRADVAPALPEAGSRPDPERTGAGPGRGGFADPAEGTGSLGGTAGYSRDTGSHQPSAASYRGDTASRRGDSGSHPGDTASDAGVADGSTVDRTSERGRRSTRGHSGSHTSPQRSPRRAERSARPDSPQGPDGTKPRRKRPASVKLAMATALVLVLAAAAALSYAVFRGPGTPKAAAHGASKSAASQSVSASPSPSLGPYGHISSRKADPTPLTMSELYPATFTVGGTSVVRTAASKGTNCAAGLVGSRIQSAIGSAGCDQVVRATYLASSQGVMGTIGVLNLSTASAATTAARSADASDFISQLGAKHGPTHKIGQGTGIEEAAAKGHYLILIWAEFTNLRKPKTAGQRTTIERFMTELLQSTANVSLAQRMLTGTP
jgi:hypothetical protein